MKYKISVYHKRLHNIVTACLSHIKFLVATGECLLCFSCEAYGFEQMLALPVGSRMGQRGSQTPRRGMLQVLGTCSGPPARDDCLQLRQMTATSSPRALCPVALSACTRVTSD